MSTWSDPTSGRARSTRVNTCLIAVLLGLVLVLVYRQFAPIGSLLNPSAALRTVTPRGDLAADETSTIELFKKASPSVVHITTIARYQDVFTRNVLEIPGGTGSGIIWDRDGNIVTNLHVIQDASDGTVTLADNTTYKASVVGVDSDHDLAVLKINAPATKLVPIEIGTSKDLQVGQKVFAIGSPFEFDLTLTLGNVSGLDRTIDTNKSRVHGAIQTDAAINPGNSGGPLLDSAGRLIGVNTAIASYTGASHGIGFAIPVDLVNLVVTDLVRKGAVQRPWLGVIVDDHFNQGGHRLLGVRVIAVLPGSPADRAGILPPQRDPESHDLTIGDRIVAINGKRVESHRDLLSLLGEHRAGETVKVRIIRESKPIELPVRLETYNPQTQ